MINLVLTCPDTDQFVECLAKHQFLNFYLSQTMFHLLYLVPYPILNPQNNYKEQGLFHPKITMHLKTQIVSYQVKILSQFYSHIVERSNEKHITAYNCKQFRLNTRYNEHSWKRQFNLTYLLKVSTHNESVCPLQTAKSKTVDY